MSKENTWIISAIVHRPTHNRLCRKLGKKKFSAWLRAKEAEEMGKK